MKWHKCENQKKCNRFSASAFGIDSSNRYADLTKHSFLYKFQKYKQGCRGPTLEFFPRLSRDLMFIPTSSGYSYLYVLYRENLRTFNCHKGENRMNLPIIFIYLYHN